MKSGWLCPRCERVNAPGMVQCSCTPSTSLAKRVGTTKPQQAGVPIALPPRIELPTPKDPPGTVRIVGGGTACYSPPRIA